MNDFTVLQSLKDTHFVLDGPLNDVLESEYVSKEVKDKIKNLVSELYHTIDQAQEN